MKHLTRDSDDHCSQCIQGCDYMRYKREIVESKRIMEDITTDEYLAGEMSILNVNCFQKKFAEGRMHLWNSSMMSMTHSLTRVSTICKIALHLKKEVVDINELKSTKMP